MKALLIDFGALALFVAYMAMAYWHAVSQHSNGAAKKLTPCGVTDRK